MDTRYAPRFYRRISPNIAETTLHFFVRHSEPSVSHPWRCVNETICVWKCRIENDDDLERVVYESEGTSSRRRGPRRSTDNTHQTWPSGQAVVIKPKSFASTATAIIHSRLSEIWSAFKLLLCASKTLLASRETASTDLFFFFVQARSSSRLCSVWSLSTRHPKTFRSRNDSVTRPWFTARVRI